jgi:tetratricopeptide (TPR) repeat protein
MLFFISSLCVFGQTRINDAYTLSQKGKFDEAVELANSILCQDSIKKDTVALINDFCTLSFIFRDSKNYSEANRFLTKGIAIWDKCHMEKDDLYLTLKNNIVYNLKNLGKYQEALTLQDEILSSRITLNGPNSKEVAEAFGNMGLLYRYMYDSPNAILYFSEQLKIYDQLFDKHSYYYLTCLKDIAQE